MTEERYLLDVNVLIALTFLDHAHHETATRWFDIPGRRSWAMCPLTEMGFLRVAVTSRPGASHWANVRASLERALDDAKMQYVPALGSWRDLTRPFARRIHGPKQVTDAYLLGLAIHKDLVLVTFDKGILHLAGPEFRERILLLSET